MLLAPVQMTAGAVDEFRLTVIAAVADAATARATSIEVDLRRTDAIDATGLGVLLLLHKRAREAGIKVRLVGPSTSIMGVLKSTRVHLLFEIADPSSAASFDAGVAEHPSFTEPSRVVNPYAEPEPSAPADEQEMQATLPDLVASQDVGAEVNAPLSGLVSGYDDPGDEGAPVALPMSDATVTDVTLASDQPSPRECPDCGRDLPQGREVQFCPWCGKNDEGASAPVPTPEAESAPVSVPVAVPVPTSVPARISVAAPPVPRSVSAPVRPPRPTRGSASGPSVAVPAPVASTPIPDASKRRPPMSVPTDDFRALLDATQLYHRIDEDGDARIIFPLESGRTQTAWITRNVDEIGEYAFRYVMSFVADAGEIAGNFALMGSLLEQVSAKKGGGLVTRGTMLLYRIPVAVQATPESLAGAVALAAGVADELETAITGEA